eukprot:6572996-Pyramimonas_sp.AAC.1
MSIWKMVQTISLGCVAVSSTSCMCSPACMSSMIPCSSYLSATLASSLRSGNGIDSTCSVCETHSPTMCLSWA